MAETDPAQANKMAPINPPTVIKEFRLPNNALRHIGQGLELVTGPDIK